VTARIVHVVNPAAPHVGARIYETDEPIGVLDAVELAGWRIPPKTLLVRDNKLVRRDDWNAAALNDNETAVLLTFPAGGKGGSAILTIIAQIALIVVATLIAGPIGTFLATSLDIALNVATAIAFAVIMIAGQLLISAFMPKPKALPSTPQQSPTYSLNAQSNQARLAQMVPEHFGRFLHVPDLASQPWFNFTDDKQNLYELFNLGVGSFEINEVHIGDNPIWKDGAYTGTFPEIQLEFVPPGSSVTLFPDNVVTSGDISGVTLLGTNEADYGYLGPFVVSKPGTAAIAVEIDIQLPEGLFFQGDHGIENATVAFTFEAQQIDNSGTPVGDFFSILTLTLTLAQRDAVRRTYRHDFETPARYRIRAKRTNQKKTGGQTADLLIWLAMRGFLPSQGVYPGCTMMALMATATSNLNSNSADQIKVLKTRKLPMWNKVSQAFDAAAPTRSIAAAAIYAATSDNGGKLPATPRRIDLDKLADLDPIWTERGDFFDGVFDSQQSLLEAIQAIVQVGRTRMVMAGSTMTFVRDEPRTIPHAGFSPRNILPNSLQITYAMHDVNTVDALTINYVDARIWQPHSVLCKFDDSDATLETAPQLSIFGITDYAHAWREGIYMVAANRYRRRIVDFQTELEGRACMFGDLVSFSHYMPNWGFAADVTALLEDDAGDVLTLSEPYTVPEGQEEEQLLIRILSPDGQTYGPVECEIIAQEAVDPRTTLVRLLGTATIAGKYAGTHPRDWPVWSGDGLQKERPRASLGQGTVAPRDAIVIRMSPQDGVTTAVQVAIEDSRVHTADEGDPPDDPNDPGDTPVVDLTITAVTCSETDAGGGQIALTLTITGAASATYYLVKHKAFPGGSYGDPLRFNQSPVGGYATLPPFNVPAGMTQLSIVAAGDAGSGPSVFFVLDADGVDDVPPGDVGPITTLTHWSSGNIGSWTWDAIPNVAAYGVVVWARMSDSDPWTALRGYNVATPGYTYYPAMEIADGGPWNHLRIAVHGENGAGRSPDDSYSSEDP